MSESDEDTKMTVPDEVTLKLAELLKNLQNLQNLSITKPATKTENLGEVVISTKLSGDNYPLWANLIRRAIGGKGLTSHISSKSVPPAEGDPHFAEWEKLDHCVFGWIINNIDPELVNEVSQYPTARELWEGLAVTYGSGGDSIQVYDIHRRASNMKQGGQTLEQLWNGLQNLWMSIDRRKPNPMKCPEDIGTYNKEKQETRLFQFLMALNENHEAIRREILKKSPLPTAKEAYAIVRREATNNTVLKSGVPNTPEPQIGGIGSGLAARGGGKTEAVAESTARRRPEGRGEEQVNMQSLWTEETYQRRVFPPRRISRLVGRNEAEEGCSERRTERRPDYRHRRSGGQPRRHILSPWRRRRRE